MIPTYHFFLLCRYSTHISKTRQVKIVILIPRMRKGSIAFYFKAEKKELLMRGGGVNFIVLFFCLPPLVLMQSTSL